jgi:hypothetical protein
MADKCSLTGKTGREPVPSNSSANRMKRRWWLLVALGLFALKLAITGLWIAHHHHIAPLPPHAIEVTLWWATKVSVPMLAAALAMDAHQMGNRFYERLFIIGFLIAAADAIITTYAMLHGYKGIPLP